MTIDWATLVSQIKVWGQELGFQQIGMSDLRLTPFTTEVESHLANQYHGEMNYLERNKEKRYHPELLLPETKSIIIARMDYLPPNSEIKKVLQDKTRGYISRYALGRDYHKLIRKRLQKLAQRIEEVVGPFVYRSFTDSAPVLEKPIAAKAGLGWQGKNTLILNRQAGSWFFLGALYTSLPLRSDPPISAHCGSCQACLDVCPTSALIGPARIDSRRCISYLTIEYSGIIPEELRALFGNRVYGCDDCQLVCPWNRFAKPTTETAFHPRHRLENTSLLELFLWSEQEFQKNTEGSAIRRISYAQWLRNLAIGLGNAPTDKAIIEALKQRLTFPCEVVQEHVQWALKRHGCT